MLRRTRARRRGVRLPGRSWLGVGLRRRRSGWGSPARAGRPAHVSAPSILRHRSRRRPRTPCAATGAGASAQASARRRSSPSLGRVDAAVDRSEAPAGPRDRASPRLSPAPTRRAAESIDRRRRRPAGRRSPAERRDAGARGRRGRGREPRPSHRAQRGRPLLHRPLPGAPARLVRGGPLARAEAPPPHPRGLRRGRHPAGPRLRRPRGERLQDDRLLAGEGEGRLAVRERDRQALRPRGRLVGGRAERPREGHPGRGALPEGAPRPLRGLEPRPGRLQRGRGQGAPRHAAVPDRRLLEAARRPGACGARRRTTCPSSTPRSCWPRPRSGTASPSLPTRRPTSSASRSRAPSTCA